MPAKPVSNDLKQLRGNPGHQALTEPAPIGLGVPRRPAWLPKEAKAEWDRVVPSLDSMRALAMIDRAALTDYCLCWARLVECEQDISERGVLVAGERGKVKNPALQIARTYRQALQKWCVLFGFTPDSRGRMNLPDPPKASKWDEL